jgi:hypothetical protein
MRIDKDPFDCRYAHGDDIRTKLNACYILYDGIPCYVETNYFDDEYQALKLTPCDREGRPMKSKKVYVNDEGVNQYNFNIGWYNRPASTGYGASTAAFGERIPYRAWKQGLHSGNISLLLPNGNQLSQRQGPMDDDIVAMMYGEYPELDSVFNSSTMHSMALSKDVCLTRDITVNPTEYYNIFVGRLLVGRLHVKDRSLETTKTGMFSVIYETLNKVGIS